MFFRHLLYFSIGYVCLQYAGYLMPDLLFYRKFSGGGYYSAAQSLNDFFMLLLYRPIPVFLSLFFYLLGLLFVRYVILKRITLWRGKTYSAFIHFFLISLGVFILWVHFSDPIVRIFLLLLIFFDIYRFVIFLTLGGKNYNSYGI